MEVKKGTLLKCIAIPVLTGALSALISSGGMQAFEQLNKPPLSPPGWLFPVVWTILYVLMGIASYLIVTADTKENRSDALRVYGLQLVVNFFWSIFFFNLEWYLFSFVWLILLWILILVTILRFYPISKTAAKLMIPYLVWVTFAGYLNLAIWILN
ncbi:MAG: tryptophan-rich sensory protein [Lachnospiraceae bacterium]|nr:tryptophan-rich sensory protein [Lachnospiraceae bacterium]